MKEMEVNSSNYKTWINKFIESNDTREINFQNDVVKPLLEKLFSEYNIVYADIKGPDANKHDYYAYSGKYIDKNGKEKPTTPDLLICRNWNWNNLDNEDIQYIATIEVKSPFGNGAIYKKQYCEYPKICIEDKIKTHLSANKIDKVILTDTFKWEFFDGDYNNHESISLANRVKQGRGYTYQWCDDFDNRFLDLINKLEDFLG